jgi:Lon protease-like protein
MIDVALFPIPDCVVFPGMAFPLHVFEPRYRAMVRHCSDTGMMLGVCDVEKMIHGPKPGQTVEQTLNSNQATYKPVKVFSAGRCDIEEVFKDGRLRITLHAETRLRALKEIQTLPFSICSCEEFTDNTPGDSDLAEAESLKDKVLHRLLAVLSSVPELSAMLSSPDFQNLSPEAFSFRLFQFLRFSPELQQTILESQSPGERLELVLEILNKSR